ncbi:MAG: hypothetical protein A2Y62_19290 [Candidatus Fischerbacteria bacterium RBG_13_37_8]|uniref:Radical SAM core domain-containing protein n=1 Tax=Candidatus Fischerbacteria bacterium RBG_13_37_8 TaxID=1817863 RepID=A0A1F5VX34_9BACT|nr:MAG: hypothetical protein A2Y62_19290 [Candidatus Fischerbacteria bacterium RBG_13_37_8]
MVSTLLVPGYIDSEEVHHIASFLASLKKHIPYCLLAFYPQFYMNDLPATSRTLAEQCASTAQQAGLTNIKVGNMHLLK